MNPLLSTLPLSLQLLTLVALLVLFVLDSQLLPLLQTVLGDLFASLGNNEWVNRQGPKVFAWLEKRKWGARLIANPADLMQKLVLKLLLGSFQVRLYAVLVCLWFGRWEAAYLWAAFPWLYTLGLGLVGRLLKPRRAPLGDGPVLVTDENCAELGLTPEKARAMQVILLEQVRRASRPDPAANVPVIPADLSNCAFYSATDPDFEQRVVTVGNCADFGLTPEQVGEIAKSDAPFKPDGPSDYTFFGMAGVEGGPRLVIAERNRPDPADATPEEIALCAEYGLTPARAKELLQRVIGNGDDFAADAAICAEYGLTSERVDEFGRRLMALGERK